MDDKTTRVGTPTKRTEPMAAPKKPAATAHRFNTEMEDARDGLGPYVSELDRSRQEALKLQVRRHKAVGIGMSVATVAAVAGAVALLVQSRRRAALPWAPWRIVPTVAKKSGKLGRFLVGTAIPVALRAAKGAVDRASSLRPRMA